MSWFRRWREFFDGVERPIVSEVFDAPGGGVGLDRAADGGGRVVCGGEEGGVFPGAEVAGIPRENLREACSLGGGVELVARAVAEEELRLIVELGLESGCFVGRGAEDGAGAGGADEGKVGAGVLELDADGLMLDLVERQFFAADDGEGDLLGSGFKNLVEDESAFADLGDAFGRMFFDD